MQGPRHFVNVVRPQVESRGRKSSKEVGMLKDEVHINGEMVIYLPKERAYGKRFSKVVSGECVGGLVTKDTLF